MANDFAYPFDPLGTESSNKITTQAYAVVPPSKITDASVVIPRAAPFFADGLVIKAGTASSKVTLTRDVDYHLVYRHQALSRYLARSVYGGILLVDRNFNGTIWFEEYQTVGGPFTLDDQAIVEAFSRSLHNVRYVFWEQFTGMPSGFAPTGHPVGGDTLVGLDQVVDSISTVAAAITTQGGGGADAGLDAHLNAISAHSKSQVGLGNVNNWPVAILNDYTVGSLNTYATASGVKAYVEQALSDIDLTDLEDTVEALELTQASLVGAVDTHTLNLSAMSDAIDAVEEDIEDLELWGSGVDSSISTMASEIAGITSSVSSANATATAADTNASSALTAANNATGDVATLTTTVNANAASIVELNDIVEANKLQGVFSDGNFDFVLLPGEAKEFIIVATGGHGGSHVTTYREWKDLSSWVEYVDVKRHTNKTDGTLLSVPVPVIHVNGGGHGEYSYDTEYYGTGGAAGTVVLDTGEVDTSPAPVTTNGTVGTDGDAGDAGPTTGGGGHTIGGAEYGRGMDGSAKAGAGGSGGYSEFTMTNDTAYPLRYSVNISRLLSTGILGTNQDGMVSIVHVPA